MFGQGFNNHLGEAALIEKDAARSAVLKEARHSGAEVIALPARLLNTRGRAEQAHGSGPERGGALLPELATVTAARGRRGGVRRIDTAQCEDDRPIIRPDL